MVEGAARYVVGERLDNSGMRWIEERAEAVLLLRCIEVNGDSGGVHGSGVKNGAAQELAAWPGRPDPEQGTHPTTRSRMSMPGAGQTVCTQIKRRLASADHRLLEDRFPEIAELRRHAGLAAGLAQERFGRKARGPLDGRIDVNMTKFGVEAGDDVRHALDERPELAILSLQRSALLLSRSCSLNRSIAFSTAQARPSAVSHDLAI